MYTVSLSLSLVATATTGITLTDAAAACSPPASLWLLAGLSTLTLKVEEWCSYISCTETIICSSFFIYCYFLQCAHLKIHKSPKPPTAAVHRSAFSCQERQRQQAWMGLSLLGRKKTNKKKETDAFLSPFGFFEQKTADKVRKKKNQERRGRLWALSVSLRHPSHPSHLFCLLLIWRVWSSNFQMTSSMSQCFWKYQRRGHSTWTPPPQPLHPFAHAGTVTPLVVAFIRVTWEESPV